jgi:hypothetical protein
MKPYTCLRINVLLVCLCMSINAFACSTAAWLGGTTGAVSANNPANGVLKVSGSCGFKVTGLGYVQDNSPEAEAQFIGRFYFFPEFSGAGSADIFVAYSDEAATELFSVGYDGSNVTIDATAAPGGNSVSVPVTGNRCHLIEFSWVSGDSGGLWVDADATLDDPNATFASGSGVVESVRLGAPNGLDGLSGMAYFDDYVSHRTSPIGGILPGDGNLSGGIDEGDIDAIKSEFLYGTYSDGSTDCNLDGGVNSGDVNCVVEQLP